MKDEKEKYKVVKGFKIFESTFVNDVINGKLVIKNQLSELDNTPIFSEEERAISYIKRNDIAYKLLAILPVVKLELNKEENAEETGDL